MRRTRRLAGLVVLAVTVLTQLVVVPVARAAPAPLGYQNWVVSAAGFRTDAYRNYLRLGYLVFSATANTVEHNFWTWNQENNPAPVPSGDVYYCGDWVPGTNPRNNCAIKTAPGFTGSPNGHFTGTYQYDAAAGQARITWTTSTIDGTTTAVNLAETWTVSTPRAGLGRMQLATDNYSLTSGIGYGSNASFDQAGKASMATIRTRTGTFLLEGQSWNGNTVTTFTRGASGGLSTNGWLLCDDGSCLGNVQYNAGCSAASCCPPGDGYQTCVDRLAASGNRRFYYLTGQFGGRRNTYEFWCECLSYEACYERNSHVRPLLQVIDDSGTFRGWVGAEVSPDRTAPRDPRGEFYASFALVD
ncbi:hypothetical protein AB0J86_36900 [Micromonospora sp. NPDC049559]|uniref:hypothetical protein n=1 Tax=Micromonospora sp. NPDC049559 TaxID=3155923 RepID=UPI003445552D